MNQRMNTTRRRLEFLCLAVLAGTLPSGCAFNRPEGDGHVASTPTVQPANRQPPSRQDVTQFASASPSVADSESPSPSTHVQTAYPPIFLVSESRAVPEPQPDDRPLSRREVRRVVHADEATFEQEVIQSAEPVLVDFYADWCGPCKRLSPTLEEVARESSHARVAKVDIEKSPELAARFGVKSLPTFIVFKDGKAVAREKGLVSKERLLSMLDL